MINKKYNKLNMIFLIPALILALLSAVIFSVSAAVAPDTTRPTIIQLSSMNNEQDIFKDDIITVMFSEDINPSTINANTFKVMQRTTPEFGDYRSRAIDGIISYNGRVAVFNPTQRLAPGQDYGNVFTVTLTTGITDLAGNSLLQDYMWSFTTGGDIFNTGVTTSQQGQGQIPADTSVINPGQTASAPVSTTTTTTTTSSKLSTFPWIWVIGAALLLLILILAFTGMKKPEKQKSKEVEITSRKNSFGNVYPVMDMEGIGPKYNRGLLAMGIKNTEQLWHEDSAKIARKTGASLSQVESWQNMSELASVKGIGPQYAELLERSGIHSIKQLHNSDPDKVLRLVTEKQNSLKINIQGNTPGHATVENWIEEAQSHKFSDSKRQEA